MRVKNRISDVSFIRKDASQMRKIRKGKDISVRWPILTNGEPLSLDGRDLTLFIKSQYNVAKELDFTTEDNVVVFTFAGTEQQMLGTYKLTLWENYGKAGQTAVDYCDAFTLVPCTCEETPGDDGLATETFDLESSSIEVGIGGVASCIVEATTFLEFPSVGKSNTLYVDKSANKTYRWDEELFRYLCVGSDYEDVEIIDGGTPYGIN